VTPDGIQPGGVYHIGRGCGVPYEWAPIVLRIIRVENVDPWNGRAWIHGYQLNQAGDAVEHREIYVGVVAGMWLIAAPATTAARPHNERPVLPRQRTPITTTTGRRTR
jgi:hypothetical protein